MPSLHLELKIGETIKIGGPASVTLESKSGQRARLNIQADEGVRIERPERLQSGAAQARLGVRSPEQ